MKIKYKVIIEHLDLQVGEIVEEFHGNTYGCLLEDTIHLKTECMAVTRGADSPFRIIPKKYLQEEKA